MKLHIFLLAALAVMTTSACSSFFWSNTDDVVKSDEVAVRFSDYMIVLGIEESCEDYFGEPFDGSIFNTFYSGVTDRCVLPYWEDYLMTYWNTE